MEIHRWRCYIVVYKLCMIYISYSLINRYMIYSYTFTLSVHCNVWQNACASGGSNPRVFDVQTVKHGWTPIVDHLCSFKAPFLMLKTLAFVSSKTWEPASEAARDSQPLEGAEWHDDIPPESWRFFQGWCHGALKFLVGWTKHRKINRGFLNHPLDYNVGPPNDS